MPYGIPFSAFVRLAWVMPNQVLDLFACWKGRCRFRDATMRKMVSLCLMWSIWREINDRMDNRESKGFFL